MTEPVYGRGVSSYADDRVPEPVLRRAPPLLDVLLDVHDEAELADYIAQLVGVIERGHGRTCPDEQLSRHEAMNTLSEQIAGMAQDIREIADELLPRRRTPRRPPTQGTWRTRPTIASIREATAAHEAGLRAEYLPKLVEMLRESQRTEDELRAQVAIGLLLEQASTIGRLMRSVEKSLARFWDDNFSAGAL